MNGQKFHRLLILSEAERRNGKRMVRCLCDCGNETVLLLDSVKRGNTKSCGCFRREFTAAKNFKHGHNKNAKPSKTYTTWAEMLARCSNRKHKKFEYYGGRGITVCERWRDFANFLADMGEGPAGLSLDRINNDGNYEPGNCRWATKVQQANNRRNNHIIEHDGLRLTMAEWSRRLNLKHWTIFNRLKYGWSIEKALGDCHGR